MPARGDLDDLPKIRQPQQVWFAGMGALLESVAIDREQLPTESNLAVDKRSYVVDRDHLTP
jgi:hypothetical protein